MMVAIKGAAAGTFLQGQRTPIWHALKRFKHDDVVVLNKVQSTKDDGKAAMYWQWVKENRIGGAVTYNSVIVSFYHYVALQFSAHI